MGKKPFKILVIDDNLFDIDVLRNILESEYTLTIATNGVRGLELARSGAPPDLILLDVMMPDMDGHDACRHLKADPRTRAIPIIFVTARGNIDHKVAGFELGADDYFVKPIIPHMVRLRITHHLELKRHREHLEELVRERTAQLEVAKKLAEAGNRAKSEFLSLIGHELRTPLNTILGFTSILATPGNSEQTCQKYAAWILSAGNALLEMINEILDLVQLERDAEPVVLPDIPFKLSVWIQEILASVTRDASDKGLRLTRKMDPRLPEIVRGDLKRLGRAVLHLLRNAIKFTESGDISLEVGLDDASGQGVLVRFTVRDTGPGIPAWQRERIFARFTQIEPAFTRSHQGMGLGLTICRRYAALMGGTVSLESEEGRGSAFHLTARLAVDGDLPLERATEPTLPVRVASWRDNAPPPPAPMDMDGEQDSLKRLRARFFSEGTAHLHAMQNALASQNATLAQSEAERLQSLAVGVGADLVKIKTIRFKTAVRGAHWDKARTLFQELTHEYTRSPNLSTHDAPTRPPHPDPS
ncbi:MAG: response regulator [Magnetococcales bacterium]|nr:response regulator [Magnetococcales bacterium]